MMLTDDSSARTAIIFFAGVLGTLLVSILIPKLGGIGKRLSKTGVQEVPELKELKELHEDTSQRAAIEVAIESKRIARKKKFEFHEMLWTTPLKAMISIMITRTGNAKTQCRNTSKK